MKLTIPAGVGKNKSQVILDLSKECGAFGVVVSSLDGSGAVYVSTEQGQLDQAADINSHPRAGFLIQQLAVATNIPSTILLAPFSDILYARNFGAADSDIDVTVWRL